MICCPQACRPQTSWNLKVDDADSYLPHHQPIRGMSTSWSHALWSITIKLLTNLSRWGRIVFRGRSFSRQEPALSPFASQSNKALLFYFTQNSVSEIGFSTDIQRSWAFGIKMVKDLTSSGPWASLYVHCNTLADVKWHNHRCQDSSEADHKSSKSGQWSNSWKSPTPSPK